MNLHTAEGVMHCTHSACLTTLSVHSSDSAVLEQHVRWELQAQSTVATQSHAATALSTAESLCCLQASQQAARLDVAATLMAAAVRLCAKRTLLPKVL